MGKGKVTKVGTTNLVDTMSFAPRNLVTALRCEPASRKFDHEGADDERQQDRYGD